MSKTVLPEQSFFPEYYLGMRRRIRNEIGKLKNGRMLLLILNAEPKKFAAYIFKIGQKK